MSDVNVVHNPEAGRFEVHLDGHLAFLQYDRTGKEVTIVHTEVPKALGGRGLGTLLAKAATDWGRSQSGVQLVVLCPFVREYMRKHAG
jgi:predicted GNAT family acetyltransferase